MELHVAGGVLPDAGLRDWAAWLVLVAIHWLE
jgi:hypothetical protein